MAEAADFRIFCPVSFFEKADAPAGKRRRIGGIVSTESKDRQDEVVLQRGLDFNDFLRSGWYNDNHTKSTTGGVGIPESVQMFQKGARLPDGSAAKTAGHWAEGYLLDCAEGERIWDYAQSLAKAGNDRRLGYSIEGKIDKRTGPGRKTIAKARVRNVAITNCPVNTETRMEALAKSLRAAEDEEEDTDKALAMGTASGINPPPGPVTGEGAGQVITGQSLESDVKPTTYGKKKKKKRKRGQHLNKAQAVAWLDRRLPSVSTATLGRIVDLTAALKQRGSL